MNPRKAIAVVLFLNGSVIGATAQTIDFGKSYINVTKGINGGTLESGDTLEIRASFVVKGTGSFDSCGFRDVIPAGTVYIPGTVRVLTNEGKIYKQFTDATGDDAGWFAAGNVGINLGFNAATYPATAFRRGKIANTDKPSFYGSTCIMIASFRVKVTAATGSAIATGGGAITYRNAASVSNPVITTPFPANTVAVYTNYGMCANSVGANALGTEFNGTFGTGVTQNRGTSGNVPAGYTYATFTANGPNDYYYGVANNTSNGANFTTSNAWAKPDNTSTPTHRVFSVWDVIGDHTNATDPYAGNAPGDNANTTGYMLVINAAYRIDSAFQQTISGLCPNTYYEISCWMRNICSKCGCDVNGIGSSSGNAAYIPTAPGDSSGVYPNLTFDVDGIDYYTTGNLLYTGKWVKKGFTFLTGPAQTSFTLKFFNNAPGGGGNDWALDDISVATCSPDLTFTPTNNPRICANNTVNIGCIIQSYFNNYTYYKWQKSTDGGLTWNDTGAGGIGNPTWNGSQWQYTVQYPTFVATTANNGDKYRVVIGTTAANVNSATCSFSGSNTSVVTLNVIDCGSVLRTDIISFTGKKDRGNVQLQWTATEASAVQYTIERSTNSMLFTPVATVAGAQVRDAFNTYRFTDASVAEKTVQYRIRLSGSGQEKLSRILHFTENGNVPVQVVNPFSDALQLRFEAAKSEVAQLTLVNMNGQIVRQQQVVITEGGNDMTMRNTGTLPDGMYTVQLKGTSLNASRCVLKQGRL